jgi:HopA1 effector protein family
MQLLDSPLDSLQTSLLDVPQPLQVLLQDIANNLEIQSFYSIKHPNYKPLELPSEAVSRFQQLPSDLQNKFLKLQLSNFLYGVYYNGSLKKVLAIDADETDSINKNIAQKLENNTFLGVDVAFYDRLHQSNQGQGYFSHNWQVVREEPDGTLAVHKGGLTLHIDPNLHLQTQVLPIIGDLVAIKLPKNLVQNGFYMAVSDAGSYDGEEIVRVYFNLTPDGSVAVMESLTGELNAISIEFNFKALYNPSDYDRYDSAVLYFDKHNYEVVHPILERVYAKHQADFQPEVPLFTKMIAPGLAIAEEPDQKFGEKESFGMNRCQIVANGLLEAWEQGNNSPDARMVSILEKFAALGIGLQHPYLNANSQDIYGAFKL